MLWPATTAANPKSFLNESFSAVAIRAQNTILLNRSAMSDGSEKYIKSNKSFA